MRFYELNNVVNLSQNRPIKYPLDPSLRFFVQFCSDKKLSALNTCNPALLKTPYED